MTTTLIILAAVGALIYILAGYKGEAERVGELGRITFFCAVMALLLGMRG